MRIIIDVIHVGMYRITVPSPTGGDLLSFEGGSGLLMRMLTNLIFEAEALQYETDRQRSSNQLAIEALEKMRLDPGLTDDMRKLIESRMK